MKISRQFGLAVKCTAANDFLQFDFMYIDMKSPEAASGETYVLMLMDEHSKYSWIFEFPGTSAEHADRVINERSVAIGVLSQLMSDGFNYSRNEVWHLPGTIPHS